MNEERIDCRWCGRNNCAPSGWEQQALLTGEWHPLCGPCSRRRLANPYNVLFALRKVGSE